MRKWKVKCVAHRMAWFAAEVLETHFNKKYREQMKAHVFQAGKKEPEPPDKAVFAELLRNVWIQFSLLKEGFMEDDGMRSAVKTHLYKLHSDYPLILKFYLQMQARLKSQRGIHDRLLDDLAYDKEFPLLDEDWAMPTMRAWFEQMLERHYKSPLFRNMLGEPSTGDIKFYQTRAAVKHARMEVPGEDNSDNAEESSSSSSDEESDEESDEDDEESGEEEMASEEEDESEEEVDESDSDSDAPKDGELEPDEAEGEGEGEGEDSGSEDDSVANDPPPKRARRESASDSDA